MLPRPQVPEGERGQRSGEREGHDPPLLKVDLTYAVGRSVVAEIPERVSNLGELLGMERDLFPKNIQS